jgi:lysophospholipase L1-like esterase
VNQPIIQKTILYYIYGSVLAVVFFFGAAELVVRTVSLVSGKGFTLALAELDAQDEGVMQIYRWHPFTGITFQPNMQFQGGHPSQKKSSLITVDQNGFLAADQGLSYEKSVNEIRIATIGGSTTANVHLNFEENWPGRLGFLLQQSFPDKKITIINGGIPGFDTAQSIGNLALRVLPFSPDLVIIYHSYNDLKAIRPDRPFSPDYSHIHTKPYGHRDKPPFLISWLNRSMFYVRIRNKHRELKQATARLDLVAEKDRLASIPVETERIFEQHILTLVAIARGGGAKVVLSSFATLHDPRKNYYQQEIADNLSALQKQELIGLLRFTPGLTLRGIFSGIERYNAVLHKVAQEKQTGWVDNANGIPHSDKYFVDRVHFSADGAALMAENLLPAVVKQLKR